MTDATEHTDAPTTLAGLLDAFDEIIRHDEFLRMRDEPEFAEREVSEARQAIVAEFAALQRQLADAQARERAAVTALGEIREWCASFWKAIDNDSALECIAEIDSLAEAATAQPADGQQQAGG